MGVDRRLQHPVGISSRIAEGLAFGLGLQARDLGLEAGDLRGERGEIGGGKGRIKPRQQLAGLHLLPLVHVDRAHDRGVQRLHQDRWRFRNHDALRRHHLIDRDQPQRDDQRQDHAGDDPDDAAGRARDRRIDDRRRRPLELEDGRQRRIVRRGSALQR